MKKRNLKSKGRNENGITLIALVVTIVVLLILAGISISIVLGEGGIIDAARRAGELTNAAIANEQQMLQNLENWTNDYLSGNGESEGTGGEQPPVQENQPVTQITLSETEVKIGTERTKQLTAIVSPENASNKDVTWSSESDGIATVEADGTITGKGVGETNIVVTANDGSGITAECKVIVKLSIGSLVGKPSKTENQEAIDDDGKILTVPGGYVVPKSTEENTILYADEANPKVEEGIVIADALTGGNEFVWVPVANVNTMYETVNEDGVDRKIGKLYEYWSSKAPNYNAPTLRNYTQGSDYREPDVLTDTTNGDAGTADDKGIKLMQKAGIIESTDTTWTQVEPKWKKQLQDGFDEMIESVAKYGGFYIGRYETGGLSSDGVTIAVVKAGQKDIHNTNWYNMYASSKKIAEGKSKVESSMIWGSQWDAVMNWFLSSEDEETKKYVTDSGGKGNYNGLNVKLEATGSNPAYQVKNIYDMAGNVFEWTLEARDDDWRMYRGGYYLNTGGGTPVSSRGNERPWNARVGFGSRATLFCKPKS